MFKRISTERSSIAEVARALARRAEDISVALFGKPTTKSRHELRWGRRGSLALRTSGDKRGLWCDFERGEGGDLLDLIARERGVSLGEAIRIAERDYLGGAEMPPSPSSKGSSEGLSCVPSPKGVGHWDSPPDASDEERTRWALRRWNETVAISGTLAERYFIEHRGLDIGRLALDHCLRWHPGICAVVALMRSPVTGKPTGIHRTFLNADGTKSDRMMLGRQGSVCLSPYAEVTMGPGITEGVEDGISVLLSGWAPVWAATSAVAVANFPVLSGIEGLTIFADADKPGIEKAEACASRWRSAGLQVRISPPRGMAHA